MKLSETIQWWLRGIRLLRHPSLVCGLGEIKTEWDSSNRSAPLVRRSISSYRAPRFWRTWEPHPLTAGDRVTVERGSTLSWPVDHNARIDIGSAPISGCVPSKTCARLRAADS